MNSEMSEKRVQSCPRHVRGRGGVFLPEAARFLSHLRLPPPHRNSRQTLQPVQWLYQWQGAADGLQHPDGNTSSAALQSPAPLQFPLRQVWRLRLAQRGRAGPEVRPVTQLSSWKISRFYITNVQNLEEKKSFLPPAGHDLFKYACHAV